MSAPKNLPVIAPGDWRAFADFIERLPANDDASAEAGFDMRNPEINQDTKHPCGTAGCIGGWARTLSGLHHVWMEEGVMFFASEISRTAAERLCYPGFDCSSAYDATPRQGAAAIRNCAIHGEPRWREVMGLEVTE